MTNRYAKFETTDDFIVDSWTADDTNAHIIDHISDDISGDKGWIYPETSAQRLKRNRLKGGITYSGEIQVPLYPREATSLLYYALGSCTTVTNGSTSPDNLVNKHTIKMANSLPNFRMAMGKDKKEHRYTGGCIKEVTVDYSVNEPLLLSCDTMFRKEDPLETLSSVSFPDFNIGEKAFAGANVTTEINDTTVNYFESASIQIANSIVEDNFVLGSQYIPEKFVEGLEVTANFEMAYADSARYNDFLDEVEPKLELIAKYGEAIAADATANPPIAASNSTRQVTLEMPILSFNTSNLPTDSTSRYLLEVEAMAERDSTDNAIYVYVLNDRTNEQMVG